MASTLGKYLIRHRPEQGTHEMVNSRMRVLCHQSANCPVCDRALTTITGDLPLPDDRLVCVIHGVVGTRAHPTVMPPDRPSTLKPKYNSGGVGIKSVPRQVESESGLKGADRRRVVYLF
jgi:hypothetical protein